jgi:hypothetical protein
VQPAESLALKLVVTPLLVGAASLAGRRWGSAVGGWLVGIPFTSGPIAFFLALGLGTRFAAAAAAGIMAGTASQAAFCLGYAWTSRRSGWILSLVAATVAFIAVTAMLDVASPPTPVAFVLMLGVLALSLRLMPQDREMMTRDQRRFPAWDIPARMVVATAFVVALTAAAPLLGPRLAGLVAPFPLYGTVLAVFAHRIGGAPPAIGVLRGLLLGLFAFAVFFFALAELLEPQGIAFAFIVAIVLAAGVQMLSLAVGRRLGIA